MVTVTLPPPHHRPEVWSVTQTLMRAGMTPQRVVFLLAAGDPGALIDSFGLPRETVLYLALDGSPRTALLGREGRVVDHFAGWPAT